MRSGCSARSSMRPGFVKRSPTARRRVPCRSHSAIAPGCPRAGACSSPAITPPTPSPRRPAWSARRAIWFRSTGSLLHARRRASCHRRAGAQMIRRRWRDPHSSIERYYGLGLMSGRLAGWTWFGHSGGLQGYITRTCVLPEEDLAISVLTNAVDGFAHPWLEGAVQILRAFADRGAPSRGWLDGPAAGGPSGTRSTSWPRASGCSSPAPTSSTRSSMRAKSKCTGATADASRSPAAMRATASPRASPKPSRRNHRGSARRHALSFRAQGGTRDEPGSALVSLPGDGHPRRLHRHDRQHAAHPPARRLELTGCEILGKAEFLNPGGSVKDRAALYIILDAEKRGAAQARRRRSSKAPRATPASASRWSATRAATAR